MTLFIIKLILLALGAYLSVYVLHIILLLYAHFFIKTEQEALADPRTRFAVIVPAHNEELLIARLLGSIKEQRYPTALSKTYVVADNCTDSTASIAREHGTTVFERTDPEHGGKGHAIRWALEKIDLDRIGAVFIIDADSALDPMVLAQLDREIVHGKRAIQCYNGVGNPNKSWFTRLLNVSRTISNEIFHPAKQKLGFSSFLMGNGMCFTTGLLKEYGWHAFTVGEDWEYYANLVRAGEVIGFCNGARVYHQESSSLKQATSQRMRWSGGRFAITWKYGLRLFFGGLMERNLVKMEASLPLVLPNPSLGVNITIIALLISALAPVTGQAWFVRWFALMVLLQLLTFIIGVFYTEQKLKNFLAIFIAPLFLVWKMLIDLLSVFGAGTRKWKRTERRL